MFVDNVYHYNGWEITEFRTSGVAFPRKGEKYKFITYFSAKRKGGITMNTNSLDGIKRMIDQRNYSDKTL